MTAEANDKKDSIPAQCKDSRSHYVDVRGHEASCRGSWCRSTALTREQLKCFGATAEESFFCDLQQLELDTVTIIVAANLPGPAGKYCIFCGFTVRMP